MLFDLDGTLIDTIALILASMRHATKEVLGESPSDDRLVRNVGIPLRAQFAEFAPGREDEVLAAYRAYNERVHDDLIAEYPGTAEALADLGASFRLGVVTSKSREPARRGLDTYQLAGHFEVLVAADDVALHKPDPTPLLLAAERLGLDPAACAYVGDSPHDMTAALGAGMVAVAALWGPFPERVLEPGPHFAVSSMGELVALLHGTSEPFAVC